MGISGAMVVYFREAHTLAGHGLESFETPALPPTGLINTSGSVGDLLIERGHRRRVSVGHFLDDHGGNRGVQHPETETLYR